MANEMLLILNGKVVQEVQRRKYPVVAAGLIAPNVAHLFESEETFVRWVRSTGCASSIETIWGQVKEAQKLRDGESTGLERRQKKIISRVDEDMKELAQQTGLEQTSEELFVKATKPNSALDKAVFDPVTVFDRVGTGGFGAGGAWMHFPGGGWPVLGWFGWDNRISSIRISGAALLCANPWFTGPQLWLGGFPIHYHSNLGIFGFDNLASSMWVA